MDNFNFNADYWAACSALGEQDGQRLAWALLRYAYEGVEPEGEPAAIQAIFAVARGRIDAAVSGSKSNGGGRGAKAPSSGNAAKTRKRRPNAGDSQNRVSGKNGDFGNRVCEKNGDFQNRVCAENAETLPTEREGEGEVHKPIGAGACVASNEPDRGEVEAWFEANASGMPADRARSEAGQFLDHFAAQGWMTASGAPIVDWRPKARQWVGRSGLFDSRARGRAAPPKADPALAAYGRCDGVVGDVRDEARAG